MQGLGKYQKQFSPEVFGRMAQEITNIYQAAGVGVSPLYGQYAKEGELKTDYTQFTPRSHYAKTSLLRAYFRAMMYLGRNSYLLNKPEGISDALLLAHLLASPGPDGQPLVKDWQKLMEITAFYAGPPDDIGYPEWRDFLVKVLGTEKFSPAEAVNPEVLTKISQQLQELRPPGSCPTSSSVPACRIRPRQSCWPPPRPFAFSASASPSTPGCWADSPPGRRRPRCACLPPPRPCSSRPRWAITRPGSLPAPF